mmetsp:Transcript_49354/g.94334  ORF Transcript_49354/g.94334 Transcript_49354/m.94334 type:complete len:114 (+) Transcript_49354:766-1107(+)
MLMWTPFGILHLKEAEICFEKIYAELAEKRTSLQTLRSGQLGHHTSHQSIPLGEMTAAVEEEGWRLALPNPELAPLPCPERRFERNSSLSFDLQDRTVCGSQKKQQQIRARAR